MEKIFKKSISIKYLTDYSDCLLEKDENEILYIIVDDHFMDIVVEREIERANSICILCDPKNQQAKQLQKKYPKIKAIHKNLDILISSKNFK